MFYKASLIPLFGISSSEISEPKGRHKNHTQSYKSSASFAAIKRTKSSDSHSLEQEKAQKLLQYSLPEQTDKGLQHSKQSSKFKVGVRMIAPEINN